MKNIIIIFFLTTLLQAYYIHDVVKKEKAEQRVALIIGNNNYTHLEHLKNPLNDARLMKETLEKGGFSIIYKENAKIRDMKTLLREFTYKIRKGGIGFYYFAGQSVNVDGKNYLAGIDASLDNKNYINHEAIPLNTIIKKMNKADNRLNIIVSDTCRNTIALNRFGNNHFGRGVGKGLLSLANTKDIFIAYSTASGEISRDGTHSSHGILTKYLVKNLQKTGASIKEIFTNLKKDVYKQTKSKKSLDTYHKIKGDFFFILPVDRKKLKDEMQQ